MAGQPVHHPCCDDSSYYVYINLTLVYLSLALLCSLPPPFLLL
jgi:hypothetical protein